MEGMAEQLPWRILEEESQTRMSNDRPAETSARPLQETCRGSAATDDRSAPQWLRGSASVAGPNVGGNVVTGESLVSTGWAANGINGEIKEVGGHMRSDEEAAVRRGGETQVGNV